MRNKRNLVHVSVCIFTCSSVSLSKGVHHLSESDSNLNPIKLNLFIWQGYMRYFEFVANNQIEALHVNTLTVCFLCVCVCNYLEETGNGSYQKFVQHNFDFRSCLYTAFKSTYCIWQVLQQHSRSMVRIS